MNLPQLPSMPQVDLPHQLVIPLEALATFWVVANIVLGFIYLLFGLKVFRVMTTITAVLWGAALGVTFGQYIDSIIVAMIFCGTGLGVATWFYTRWMIALPFGLASAAIAWITVRMNGANPLACFFIAMSAAVGIGGPVLIFYRTVVMGLTCVQGAVLVVIGTAGGILLIRNKPIGLLLVDLQSGGHLILGAVCVLLLAIPAFYYQRLRYATTAAGEEGINDSAFSKDSFSRKRRRDSRPDDPWSCMKQSVTALEKHRDFNNPSRRGKRSDRNERSAAPDPSTFGGLQS